MTVIGIYILQIYQNSSINFGVDNLEFAHPKKRKREKEDNLEFAGLQILEETQL